MLGLGRFRLLEHSKYGFVDVHRELGRELDLLVTCFDARAPGWQDNARLQNGGGQSDSDLLVGHGILPAPLSGSNALFGEDAGRTCAVYDHSAEHCLPAGLAFRDEPMGLARDGHGADCTIEFLALWLGAPIMQESLQRTAWGSHSRFSCITVVTVMQENP